MIERNDVQMMPSKINKYIDDHANEMINCLSSLVSIPSVKAAPEGDMPYGKENARALAKMLDMAKHYGFTVTNHENYVGTIDFDAAKETTLGVVALPSELKITLGCPFSITDTHENPVPKSIPIIFLLLILNY